MSREIITLQIGHHANYVGAHFWNTERCSFVYGNVAADEVDGSCEIAHDVLFREGRTRVGEQFTYTPRVVIVDRKGSLNQYPLSGLTEAFAEANGGPAKREKGVDGWQGRTETLAHSVELDERSKDLRRLRVEGDAADALDHLPTAVLQDTDELLDSARLVNRITSWSDYMGTALSEKSLLTTEGYWHDEQSKNSVSLSEARAAFSPRNAHFEELEERVRYFVEECDYLSGFQLLADYANDELFGACSAGLLENLIAEEYGHKAVMTVPVDLMGASSALRVAGPRPERLRLALSSAFALRAFDTYSTLAVPLTMPANEGQSAYLRSAEVSAFLNVLMRSCRVKTQPRSLYELAMLARTSTELSGAAPFKFAVPSVARPFQREHPSLFAALADLQWTNLCAGFGSALHTVTTPRSIRLFVACGLNNVPLFTPEDLNAHELHASSVSAAQLQSANNLLERYVADTLQSQPRDIITLKDRLKFTYPYPTFLYRNENPTPVPISRSGQLLPRCAVAHIAQLEAQYASSNLQIDHARNRKPTDVHQQTGVFMIDWLNSLLNVLQDERNDSMRAQLFGTSAIEKDEFTELCDYLSEMMQSYCCA